MYWVALPHVRHADPCCFATSGGSMCNVQLLFLSGVISEWWCVVVSMVLGCYCARALMLGGTVILYECLYLMDVPHNQVLLPAIY
jgi:hypothetical protein